MSQGCGVKFELIQILDIFLLVMIFFDLVYFSWICYSPVTMVWELYFELRHYGGGSDLSVTSLLGRVGVL